VLRSGPRTVGFLPRVRISSVKSLSRSARATDRKKEPCIHQLRPPSHHHKPGWRLEGSPQSSPFHSAIVLSEAELESSTLFRINTLGIQWMHQWSFVTFRKRTCDWRCLQSALHSRVTLREEIVLLLLIYTPPSTPSPSISPYSHCLRGGYDVLLLTNSESSAPGPWNSSNNGSLVELRLFWQFTFQLHARNLDRRND
jgi:hypothetical protein